MEEPANREETGRNEDGTFKAGFSGNPDGRPKNTLKDYLKRKLSEMTDEQKEAWLQEHKVSGIDQWKMSEGQPQQDLTSGGTAIAPLIVKILDDKSNGDSEGVQKTP